MKNIPGLKTVLKEDDGVDILQDNIRMKSDYSSKILLPDSDFINKDSGIDPSILYSAYIHPNVYSELTAINQYVQDEANYDDLSKAFLQIAIIEMQHMDKLGDLITQLGGVKNQFWDNSYIITPQSRIEQLQNAIEGEIKTIKNYETIIEALLVLEKSPARDCIIETIEIIVEDEKVHLKTFTEFITECETVEEDINNITNLENEAIFRQKSEM